MRVVNMTSGDAVVPVNGEMILLPCQHASPEDYDAWSDALCESPWRTENIGGLTVQSRDTTDLLPDPEPGVFYLVNPQDVRGLAGRGDIVQGGEWNVDVEPETCAYLVRV